LDSDDNIVKILCNWIQFSDLQKDDVILSGIIDTRKMPCSLKVHLELRGVWHLVNEEIIVHDIPTEFERHIERVVLYDDDRIPDKYYNSINGKFMREEYRSLNSLIDKIKRLWENPTYRKGDLIIESTWNHDVVGPITDYLLHNIKICQNWDNGRIESTYTMRCKSKKGDFQGYIQSVANRSHNYEIVFGETSYGPNHPNNLDHIYMEIKIRSMQNLHIPLEAGPNSLEFIKKIAKTLYNYHLLVKETVKHIDKIDVELATRLGSVTPPNQIRTRTAIPIFETP
ncbi:2760_t:CDS:2, partial [Racocetra persica]